jgi:hypothetical protein
LQRLLQRGDELPHIEERILERHGGDTNDVGFAPVTEDTLRREGIEGGSRFGSRAMQSNGQLTAACLGIARRGDGQGSGQASFK